MMLICQNLQIFFFFFNQIRRHLSKGHPQQLFISFHQICWSVQGSAWRTFSFFLHDLMLKQDTLFNLDGIWGAEVGDCLTSVCICFLSFSQRKYTLPSNFISIKAASHFIYNLVLFACFSCKMLLMIIYCLFVLLLYHHLDHVQSYS